MNATVYARIDRLTGIVTFRPRKEPADVLQEWSSGIALVFFFFFRHVFL